MRAIRHHEFGEPAVLRLEDLPDLEPGPGQARIAVAVAGVHLLDTSLRRGESGGPMAPPELPTIPGREVAGTVDAVAADVDPSWVGRRVVAHLGMVPGGYAEQAVADIDLLVEVPARVALGDAVCAIGTGRTAMGIVEVEPPGPADVVLVLSAAGGLGWLLTQEARARGAAVVAAARGARRTALLREHGLDRVVDYGEPGWAEKLHDVTLVYDGVGGEAGKAALDALRTGGRLAMFGYSSGAPTPVDADAEARRGVQVTWSLGPRMVALPGGIPGLAARALSRVASGEWRPLVSSYPLAEAVRAHADLEGRRALGKVTLTTNSSEAS